MRFPLFILLLFCSSLSFGQIDSSASSEVVYIPHSRPEVPLRVGLVLSGGGAKGLAHIGVLKVLEEEGIYVDYVGGTSMGGLIGGLYACGYSPAELRKISLEMPWLKLLADESERNDLPLDEKSNYEDYLLSLPMDGLIPGLPKGLKSGQLISNYINKLTWNVSGIKNFKDLPIPYFCVATKLENGDTMVIQNGDLPLAMRATMSIPSVFEPVKVNGEYVIDGGLVNNFPVDVMLQLSGVSFVIGVDVGAPLYKAEEISSIIDILDQTSSYHNQERFKPNKRLTDLYIQPDITNLTALSFNDIDSIIYRGEIAARAKIEEIRALAKVAYQNKDRFDSLRSIPRKEAVFINKIEINGLKRSSKNMVIGRLGLNVPGVNSIESINSAIDRLYSSNHFKSIDYKLIENISKYKLLINLKENNENVFQLGANYNTETQASIKLNMGFRNLLVKGSKISISAVMGKNPAGELSYLIDRGELLGLGTTVNFRSRSVLTYDSDYNNTIGEYFTSFTGFSGFVFFNYSNNSVLSMGGKVDFFNFKPKVSAIPITDLSIIYYRGYIRFVNDSYDSKFYPTRGKLFNFEANYVKPNTNDPFVFFKANVSTIIPIFKRFALQPQVFVGGSSKGIFNTGYDFFIGGYNTMPHENFIKLPGVPYSSIIANNVGMGLLSLRFQLFTNHYFTLNANAAFTSENFEDLATDSKTIISSTLGYSINSPLGPVSFMVGPSNLRSKWLAYFNIGMSF